MSYSSHLVRAALRSPNKLSQLRLLRDVRAWLRVEFLGAAGQMGIATALMEPQTTQELADRLGYTETELLGAFLELGAALGQLRRRRDRWELRGSLLRALSDPALDGIAGLLEEATSYDADVYRLLQRRLRGEEPGDYLAESAETVARASRLAEFVLVPLVRDLVRRHRPARVLDVGCGSGIYLKAITDADAAVTAVGIDIERNVVEAARRNLDGWGIAHRATVSQADLRNLAPELSQEWDLVLLFQNIYYFPPTDRPDVLSRLRRLAPAGTVAVATAVADGSDPLAAHLDIVLRSTKGNFPLPTSAELRDAFKAARFSHVTERRLAPRQPIRAFVAR